jgi:hypothetical protein
MLLRSLLTPKPLTFRGVGNVNETCGQMPLSGSIRVSREGVETPNCLHPFLVQHSYSQYIDEVRIGHGFSLARCD